MARYSVRIETSAAKEIEAISSKKDRRRTVERIRALAADPRLRGCQKLTAEARRYRLRHGHHRILYAADDTDRRVEIFEFGHRKGVYR